MNKVLHNRYALQNQLGKNRGRITFLARDLRTQKLVVIKLLCFGNDFEWQDLKLFEREAQTLKTLSHPNIPSYIDYFEVKSKNIKGFALVQSYIEAKNLEYWIKSGRTFTESEIKQIAIGLLKVLDYLHSLPAAVIHRDIKPSNILFSDRSGNNFGEVYLVDFGSVKTITATEGGTMTVVGTYGYMSQEQFGGRTIPASDIYSLGATLIYLVTGIHPADLPQSDFCISFEHLTNLSPEFTTWLKWLIQPIVEKRLNSASQGLKSLEKPSFIPNLKAEVEEINLSKLRKPRGSQIKLTKNQDFLEIFIPSATLRVPSMEIRIPVTMINLILFSILLFGNLPLFSTVSIILCMLPLTAISAYYQYYVLLSIFGCVLIHINSQEISIYRNLFGLKFKRTYPYSKKDIDIRYIPTYRRKEGRTTSKVASHIVIKQGDNKYDLISSGHTLSSPQCREPEVEWLAYELSEWLGKPLTKFRFD